MPAVVMQRRLSRLMKAEREVLATTYDLETTYNTIIKEVDDRRTLYSRRKWSLNPLKWGLPRFAVYKDVQPRLYRILDRDHGFITFELTPIDVGGTSLKITHSREGRFWISALKEKLPVKRFVAFGKICPSCEKIYPPSYTYCPYCNIALP